MKVKEFLSDERKWAQNTYGRTKDEHSTISLYISLILEKQSSTYYPFPMESAVSFCLTEAIARCYPKEQELLTVINKVLKELDPNVTVAASLHDLKEQDTIELWNDDIRRTFADVKDLVEKLDI